MIQEDFSSMSEKDKLKANNHRTSRSKLTDMESYIMKKFLRRCLYESNFPMKGEIVTAMRTLISKENETITW